MFEWLTGKKTSDEQKPVNPCTHAGRFRVYGHNSSHPPCGTCLDCGKEVGLDFIINSYLEKMEAALDKMNAKSVDTNEG